jgi:lysophospholipase L1-like esterase
MLVEQLIGRQFFSVDVYIDGKPVGYLDNFDPAQMPRDYVAVEAPSGQFQKEFDLGKGSKTVTVFLPWNKKLTLQSMTLDDGAMLEPVKPEKKILFFGDSITQGYDAQRPAHRYAGQIARTLGAEEFNKAIGGECICPELVAARDNLDPDYILVAYGTNDWSKTDPETFTTNSKAFYAALAENYPQAKVFTLTPIWRSNLTTLNSKFDDFSQVEAIIREVTAPYENVTVVRGFEFVPHDLNYFSDYGLHPNDTGFDHYFENLCKAIL